MVKGGKYEQVWRQEKQERIQIAYVVQTCLRLCRSDDLDSVF